MTAADGGVTFDGFPGFVLHNARGMRRLYDEDGDELTMFPLSRTDGEAWQWLVGWHAGRSAGRLQGDRQAKADIRRALGIE